MSATRSKVMSRIRGKDTQPELLLQRALRGSGYRFRKNAKTPAGRADLLARNGDVRLAVFIDGCFWHGCPEHYVPPRTRVDFWAAKLAGNVARDQRQTAMLEALGWRVVRVWEHQALVDPAATAVFIARALARKPRRLADWRVARVEWLESSMTLERRHLQSLHEPGKSRTEERLRKTDKTRALGEARRR